MPEMPRRSVAGLVIPLLLIAGCATRLAPEPSRPAEENLRHVSVNGVQLHYTDRGEGVPIIFVHGGLADYREWLPTVEKLPLGYRAITYSRRYNFLNQNTLTANHSAAVEADDLAALIRHLQIAPAHVVGVSYGAYTSLLLSLKHPELVSSVVLAEPPLMTWLPDLPGGKEALDRFMTQMWTPAGEAFRASNKDRALRVTVDYFVGAPGAYDQIPPAFREMLMGNIREWEALTTSSEAFPFVTREDAARLSVPSLIITGEKTYAIGQLIDRELARVVPSAQRIIIPNGTHDMCSENPLACAEAIHQFVSKSAG